MPKPQATPRINPEARRDTATRPPGGSAKSHQWLPSTLPFEFEHPDIRLSQLAIMRSSILQVLAVLLLTVGAASARTLRSDSGVSQTGTQLSSRLSVAASEW